MPPDDHALTQTTDGNTVLEELFARYRRPLQAFFGSRIGYENAEEFTQETFLRFVQASYAAAAKDAGALLFTIAANLFRDHLRRLRRERPFVAPPSLTLDDEVALNVPTDAPPADVHMERQQELNLALKIIEGLPPRCATAFLMHRLQGKSHKAIAQEMNISVSMVEKHIRRAIEGLIAGLRQGPDS